MGHDLGYIMGPLAIGGGALASATGVGAPLGIPLMAAGLGTTIGQAGGGNQGAMMGGLSGLGAGAGLQGMFPGAQGGMSSLLGGLLPGGGGAAAPAAGAVPGAGGAVASTSGGGDLISQLMPMAQQALGMPPQPQIGRGIQEEYIGPASMPPRRPAGGGPTGAPAPSAPAVTPTPLMGGRVTPGSGPGGWMDSAPSQYAGPPGLSPQVNASAAYQAPQSGWNMLTGMLPSYLGGTGGGGGAGGAGQLTGGLSQALGFGDPGALLRGGMPAGLPGPSVPGISGPAAQGALAGPEALRMLGLDPFTARILGIFPEAAAF